RVCGGRVHGRMVRRSAARAPRTARRRVILLGVAMGDDLPPSKWADKHPNLARLFASVTLLVLAAVTLAWWGFLAWLIWRVIYREGDNATALGQLKRCVQKCESSFPLTG